METPIAVLTHEEPISRDIVLGWMRSEDLRTRAEAYVVTGRAWSRILPELEAEQQCPFMAEYLLECLRRDVRDDDYVHNGFEAAWELAAWIKHMVTLPEGAEYVRQTVKALESAFRSGDEGLRNRIHVGVLEHALESRVARPYFASWASSSELSEIFAQALEWAEAHEAGGT